MAPPDAPTSSTVGEIQAPVEREITLKTIAIATVCMIGFAFSYAMFATALSISMVPMSTQFHWSRTEISFAITFMTLSSAAMYPFVGMAIDRVGVKPVVMAGAIIAGLTGMLVSRQTGHLATFYAAFAVLGLCGPLSIGYTKVIAAMFSRNRGKMLALFGVESSVAFALVPLAMGQIYKHYGWPAIYLFAGAVMLALTPLVLFTLPNTKQLAVMSGQKPADAAGVRPKLPGLPFSEVVRTRAFWVILTVSAIITGPVTASSAHIIPFMEQKGFSITVATTYASIALLLGFIGSAYAGLLLDRFHTAKVATPSYVIMSIGMLLMLFVSPTFGGFPLLYLSAACGGFAASSSGPMNTYFHTRFFGLRAFTEAMGWERGATAISAAILAPAMGYVYDRTHSYNLVFTFMIFPPLVAAALYLIIGRYRYAANIEAAPAIESVSATPSIGEAIAIGAPAE